MQGTIPLGRLLGVRIGLHYSWFIIALLITVSLATHFRQVAPAWGPMLVWAAALSAALLFFASLVVHELSHAVVARSRGVPVKTITLFALGGIAHTEKDAGDPRTEFWIGLVGPVTSATIGGLCVALAQVFGPEGTSVPGAVLLWLGYINLVLAAFNLLPGFPLDGGRVLRAVLWWRMRDVRRATRVAAGVGQAVAMALIAWGVLQFVGGGGVGGLWLAFIGWFLASAAGAGYAQVAATEALRDVRVGELMTRDCPTVAGATDLRTFVERYVMRTGRRCFLVADDGRVAGLVTPHEVKQVEADRWADTKVEQVMRPLERLRVLAPEAAASEALEVMGREDVNQLPVVRDGRLEGVVSRGHILQLLQSRAELGV